MESHTGFVEEIDYNELNFLEIVGRGAFGVVSRVVWRGIVVAVKLIETESERKAFITELKTLSRVSHRNIVKLYGASTKQPVCLVMEYAEGGSLYNVLHGTGVLPNYTAAHAISWTMQCARGVEYLHSMKPKPLVHRDLKPPNLLLIARGTTLKICDFGTACDAHTHMTNNKGSAAWMAPEVFEGSNYSEKCDVFSWGIILWEVLSRRKPFDEIGGPAFRIMWAVHSGTRPPLIRNCPKPLEILMTRCWSSNPVERPSMSEVTRVMSRIFQFFSGADEPLQYPTVNDETGSSYTSGSGNSTYDNAQYTSHLEGGAWFPGSIPVGGAGHGSVSDTVRNGQMTAGTSSDSLSHISAPASLRSSREALSSTDPHRVGSAGGGRMMQGGGGGDVDSLAKRFSADLSILPEQQPLGQPGSGVPLQPPGHRRTGSHGTAAAAAAAVAAISSGAFNAPGSVVDGYAMQHSTTAPGNLEMQGDGQFLTPSTGVANRSTSWAPGGGSDPSAQREGQNNTYQPFFNLNQQLQPIEPCQSSPESLAIYQKHCKLAEDYLRMESEIMFLEKRKNELIEQLEHEEKTFRSTAAKKKHDYGNLLNENEQLKLLQANLLKQVDQIQNQRQGQN